MSWYEKLRSDYRPDIVRIVFLGESAPDPGQGPRRFFYAPELRADNLFRGIMLALYGADAEAVRNKKVAWLRRFKDDGYWLLDVSLAPVNGLSSSSRNRALRAAAPGAVERIVDAAPELGVVVCHDRAYRAAATLVRNAEIRVLHSDSIPFPLGNYRNRFAAEVRAALAKVGIDAPT